MHSHRNSSNFKLMLTLIVGILIGFTFSQLWVSSVERSYTSSPSPPPQSESYSSGDGEREERLARASDEETATTDLASRLYNETRILCWVMTSPQNHLKKAVHVRNTWGQRCNKLIFMSSTEDPVLGTVALPVGEGRGHLWNKTREAFKYVYQHHIDEADWFLKADDDTYVVVENLRFFLYPFSTEEPVYFGCKFKKHVRQGYMSGGAGYVLSKEALRRFVEQAYPNPKLCRKTRGGAEDKELGQCLQNVGVVAGDSRDSRKRGRFFMSPPEGHLVAKNKNHWYWKYIFYNTTEGLDCCSDNAISFHYIHGSNFYSLDYLIYQLNPFGVHRKPAELPPKIDMKSLMEKWRHEKAENPL